MTFNGGAAIQSAYGAEKTNKPAVKAEASKPEKSIWAGLFPFHDKLLVGDDGINVAEVPPNGLKEMESGVFYNFSIYLDLEDKPGNNIISEHFYGGGASQILIITDDDIMFDGARIRADGKTTIDVVVSGIGSILGGIGGVEGIIRGAVQSAAVEAVKRGIGFDSNIKIELPPQIRETKEGYVSKITFPGVYSFQKAKIDVRLGFRNPGRHTIVFFPDLSAEFKTLRGGITGSIASITPMDYRKAVVFNPVIAEPVRSEKAEYVTRKYLQLICECRWEDAFSCLNKKYTDKEKFMKSWKGMEGRIKSYVHLDRIETESMFQTVSTYNISTRYYIIPSGYEGDKAIVYKIKFNLFNIDGEWKISNVIPLEKKGRWVTKPYR
jgi:hypothetical protein